jgi:hypothetical protein
VPIGLLPEHQPTTTPGLALAPHHHIGRDPDGGVADDLHELDDRLRFRAEGLDGRAAGVGFGLAGAAGGFCFAGSLTDEVVAWSREMLMPCAASVS